jgi:hypothetical protein
MAVLRVAVVGVFAARRVLVIALLAAVGGTIGLVLATRASTGVPPPPVLPPPPDLRPAPGAQIALHRPTHAPGEGWVFKTYPNREGQTCWAEVIPGEGQGMSCLDPARIFSKGAIHLYVGSRQAEGDFTHWDNAWVWGFAKKPITHVQLVLRDCTVRDLPVDAGRIFADVEGPDTLHPGAWPYKLIGLDSAGTVVATKKVPFGPPGTAQARARGITAPPVPPRCA